MATEKDVFDVLKTVLDPEIAFNIVDLGLVYAVKIDGPKVKVDITFTTPMCPMGPELVEMVRSKVLTLDGVKDVDVEVVWEPAWTPDKMSEYAKMELGLV